MKHVVIASLILCVVLLLSSFSDAKKFGGKKGKTIKIKPKIKINIEKSSPPQGRSYIPVVFPGPPMLLPVGTFRRLKNNERVNCYTCNGDDKSLCALNPAGNVLTVKCEKDHYCSTVRKEVNDGTSVKPVHNVTSVSKSTKSNETSVPILDSTRKLNETLIPNIANASATNVTKGSPSESNTTVALTTSVKGESNNSTIRTKREDQTRTVISRGCKRLDFIDGFALAQRSGSNGNATERVYAQLCSSPLCNSGDGRLSCYECSGNGINHPCMKTPATAAKAVTCAWDEVCYVDRERHIQVDSNNVTKNVFEVKRGCRRSSLTVDNEGKIISRNNKLTLSCRLSSFCNSFDANRLVRNSAAPGNQIAPYSIVFGLLMSLLLGSRVF